MERMGGTSPSPSEGDACGAKRSTQGMPVIQRNTLHPPHPILSILPNPSNPSSNPSPRPPLNIPQRRLRQQAGTRLTLSLGRLVYDCQHTRRQADVHSDSFARQL